MREVNTVYCAPGFKCNNGSLCIALKNNLKMVCILFTLHNRSRNIIIESHNDFAELNPITDCITSIIQMARQMIRAPPDEFFLKVSKPLLNSFKRRGYIHLLI